jgi:hypothetical protein
MLEFPADDKEDSCVGDDELAQFNAAECPPGGLVETILPLLLGRRAADPHFSWRRLRGRDRLGRVFELSRSKESA